MAVTARRQWYVRVNPCRDEAVIWLLLLHDDVAEVRPAGPHGQGPNHLLVQVRAGQELNGQSFHLQS
jgi:hypothetical protein